MAYHKDKDGLDIHDLFPYIQAGDPSSDPDFPGENTNWLDSTTPTAPVWKRYISGAWRTMVDSGSGHAPATVLDSSSIDLGISGQQITASVILEWLQDTVAAMIVAGNNIDATYDDGAGTITIDAETLTGADITDFDERAQDAVGAMLADTATIDFTYTDATPELKADVKDGSITYAKIQDVSATDKLLGRSTAGSGDVEEIACTAAGRALLDDASAAAQKATLGLDAVAVKVNVKFGDGTNVITTSERPQYFEVPACTVVSWKVVSVDGTSGSINLPVYRAAAGSPTTFAEISGTSDPNISSSTSGEDTNLSEWSDVGLDEGDIIKIGPPSTSPTSVKEVLVVLRLTRAI